VLELLDVIATALPDIRRADVTALRDMREQLGDIGTRER